MNNLLRVDAIPVIFDLNSFFSDPDHTKSYAYSGLAEVTPLDIYRALLLAQPPARYVPKANVSPNLGSAPFSISVLSNFVNVSVASFHTYGYPSPSQYII